MTQVENTFTGETRWTAILSSDMAGFTQLSRKLDNEATYALLQDVIGLAIKPGLGSFRSFARALLGALR